MDAWIQTILEKATELKVDKYVVDRAKEVLTNAAANWKRAKSSTMRGWTNSVGPESITFAVTAPIPQMAIIDCEFENRKLSIICMNEPTINYVRTMPTAPLGIKGTGETADPMVWGNLFRWLRFSMQDCNDPAEEQKLLDQAEKEGREAEAAAAALAR